MSVAIVGAGPSGLASGKACIEAGLKPTIFEKSSGLGGIWNIEHGSTWESMRTNLSKYSCMFSDFPWNKDSDDFPLCTDVSKYLNAYAKHFSLDTCILYNTEVTRVNRDSAKNKWSINAKIADREAVEELFDYVIIGSGFFVESKIPQGLSEFSGTLTLSQKYRNPNNLKGKVVAIIGGAFSGSEIAADVATVATKVIHIKERNFWILGRYLENESKTKQIPLDLVFYKRRQKSAEQLPLEEINRRKHAYFQSLSNQAEVSDSLKVPTESYATPPYVVISDGYLEAFKANRIKVINSRFTHAKGNEIFLENGTSEKVDAVIACSGFTSKLPFFSPDILTSLNYDEADQFQPFLLHKNMYHPKLPNVAFVGMYRGPFFGVIELQARWAALSFAKPGEYYPTEEEQYKGIAEEQAIKQDNPRPQFPHGDYVELVDAIAKRIGVYPESYFNKDQQHAISLGPVIPSHFRLEGPYSNASVATDIIKECNEKFPN